MGGFGAFRIRGWVEKEWNPESSSAAWNVVASRATVIGGTEDCIG